MSLSWSSYSYSRAIYLTLVTKRISSEKTFVDEYLLFIIIYYYILTIL